MNNYTPFLKLKTNEVMALKELEEPLQRNLVPFFDFPRDSKEMTEDKFILKVSKAKKSIEKHLKNIPNLYLDNFDIDSAFTIDGASNYKYLLEEFASLPIIPVVGIDRSLDHINSVINAKKLGIVNSSHLAIRFTPEDFEDFELVEDDIEDILDEVIDIYEEIDVVFDCRISTNHDSDIISSNIVNFIKSFIKKYKVCKIIVTGSSIPPSIAEVANKGDETKLKRSELDINSKVSDKYAIFIGDYTVVSPNYSDIDIPGNIMPNIMIPKTIYSFKKKHFIIRGGAIKTHHRGNKQFNDQAVVIIGKSFYRGKGYSYGDNFIEEKSRNVGSNVMPGTILKPTINSHITFMLIDYIC